MARTSRPKSSQNEILLALADLSEAMGKGFDRVNHEISGMTDRFDKAGRQLPEIRGQLDSVETIHTSRKI